MDASHAFHARAHAWWKANSPFGWASCPLTENGVVRIMTNPSYSAACPFSVPQIIEALRQFVAGTEHSFWPDDLSLRDTHVFQADRILGARQLTDLYLLALAVNRGGRLVTFDRAIALSGVALATPAHLCVV
jgi:uncharacterized protein